MRGTLTPKRITTYALSAAASVSAAAFVAWVAMSGNEPAGTQQAKNDVPAGGVVVPASAASDSSMNQYFLLHQGVSPSSEFQGVAPYIRSVSAVRPAEQGR